MDLSSVGVPQFIDAPLAESAPGCLGDWRKWGRVELGAYSDSAAADADYLLTHVLACERSALLGKENESMQATDALRFVGLVERRKLGEPIAYLTGKCGFWSLDLAVDSRALIPRPDTEALVEWALQLIRAGDKDGQRIADLGTGSAAVALSLAKECPLATIVATDDSENALDLARENAIMLALANLDIRLGDWLAPLGNERFDLIVSNPPYIAEGDPHLPALRFEPLTALVSGPDGMDDLRKIIADAPAHLVEGGWLLLEHGFEQGSNVRELLATAGFQKIETRQDLSGKERVTGGCLNGSSSG